MLPPTSVTMWCAVGHMLENPVDPPLLVLRVATVRYRLDMKSSDNVRGAENQQERLWTHGWVVDFVDGEGYFSCPIFRNPRTTLGWQVQPSFTVVQGASSRDVLDDLVTHFGCGKGT